ncbi:hypothetical protein HHI36_021953 [Cryptolaemus montrouzieri]|uniref:Uncharacterized protein n=1 Tax=Cryptolaemus montrouzieri TaxID=559131 RepID=A0ABD2MZA5_9CUCU
MLCLRRRKKQIVQVIVLTHSPIVYPIWNLDSDATEHLVSEIIKLTNIRTLDNPVKIEIAKSGTYLMANKVGDIQITSCVGDKEISMTVKNCMISENNKAVIQKNNEVVAIAKNNHCG